MAGASGGRFRPRVILPTERARRGTVADSFEGVRHASTTTAGRRRSVCALALRLRFASQRGGRVRVQQRLRRAVALQRATVPGAVPRHARLPREHPLLVEHAAVEERVCSLERAVAVRAAERLSARLTMREKPVPRRVSRRPRLRPRRLRSAVRCSIPALHRAPPRRARRRHRCDGRHDGQRPR